MAEIVSDSFLASTTVLAVTASGTRAIKLIPDNCHTIIVFNPDTVNSLYFAVGSTGDVLIPTGVGGTVPMILPAKTSASISMGASSIRPQSTPTESDQLIYQSSVGSIQVNISYICANVL